MVGLLALLDDVVALTKVAAASLDDVAGQVVQASGKAAGVVIDDTAVTPRYVVGFAAERELPIVGRIALGSLKNKVLFLLPVSFAPFGLRSVGDNTSVDDRWRVSLFRRLRKGASDAGAPRCARK